MDITKCLMELSALPGIPGREHAVTEYIAAQMQDFCSTGTDVTGNLICMLNSGSAGKHIMLAAHTDEIGMVVTHIDDNGFLRAAKCGAVDTRQLIAQEVIIHGKQPVRGVFCSIPPHLQDEGRDKIPEMQDLAIDVGMDKPRASELISLGDAVTFAVLPQQLLGGKITGKSLDDRAGVACIMYAMYMLRGKTDLKVSALFSAQEEVGVRGAKTAAFAMNPDQAIAVDVSFAGSPEPKNFARHVIPRLSSSVIARITTSWPR